MSELKKPTNLIKLAEYQEGSVVSRTLVNKPNGTVTLFAFAKGQGLSEHTAPFEALAHVLEGEAVVSIAGKGYLVKAGEMLSLPATIPHALHADQPFKMLLTMVRED